MTKNVALATLEPLAVGALVHAPQPCRITREIDRGEFLRCLAESRQAAVHRFSRFDAVTREYNNIAVLPDAILYFYRAEPVE